ncbi:HlyU family transcriptional regulator [Aestuariicoccus sp. MJ-SS9]|uniref:HlyU family transcriptional regulator n=1 Tax=Aestuariicoccus sp. MJ-SS9 TaxID=3079855 RepID=UPI00290C9568|nr:HlyU family transcriptional regulator [Aestuariicoccus sp. MJ-SS9]MDU8911218.1 HlyU family transcriptional regulator [Aestuariicoccus sp. MJ-SS9]
MSLLSRLFGGGGGSKEPASAESVEYKGFRITPEPISEGGNFRIAARIEMDVEGETKTHHLIRADVVNDRDAAEEASLRKARQIIDEQGTRIFG